MSVEHVESNAGYRRTDSLKEHIKKKHSGDKPWFSDSYSWSNMMAVEDRRAGWLITSATKRPLNHRFIFLAIPVSWHGQCRVPTCNSTSQRARLKQLKKK
jgi:hypothetical protein